MADVKDELKGEIMAKTIEILHDQLDKQEDELNNLYHQARILKSALWSACSDVLTGRTKTDITNDAIDALCYQYILEAEVSQG